MLWPEPDDEPVPPEPQPPEMPAGGWFARAVRPADDRTGDAD